MDVYPLNDTVINVEFSTESAYSVEKLENHGV